MGGKPSRTRKLTIENDDPTSVIKVSEELVQRLKSNEGVRKIFKEEAVLPAAVGSALPGTPPPPPYYEPPLTSLQIRQEREKALKQNDNYWENRVTELERNHEKMHRVMECEYKKAMKEIAGDAKLGDKIVEVIPPCIDNRQAVMDCYKKYPKEPMRCAKEVEAFAECVDMKRATLVDNRG